MDEQCVGPRGLAPRPVRPSLPFGHGHISFEIWPIFVHQKAHFKRWVNMVQKVVFDPTELLEFFSDGDHSLAVSLLETEDG